MQITRKSRPVGTRKWHLETVYAVTSLPTYQASPGQLAGWVRGHWGIEVRHEALCLRMEVEDLRRLAGVAAG